MRNFQDTFETRKRSFINAFSICITVPIDVYPVSFLKWQIKGLLLSYNAKRSSKDRLKDVR